jgi:WD40 repeat protein
MTDNRQQFSRLWYRRWQPWLLFLMISLAVFLSTWEPVNDNHREEIGQELVKCLQTDRFVRRLVFDAIGDRLATGDEEGTVQIWNPVDGKKVHICDLPPELRAENPAVNGTRRADSTVGVSALSISADANYVVSSDYRLHSHIRIWDMRRGRQQCQMVHTTALGMNQRVERVALSLAPNGTLLAVATRQSGLARVRLMDPMTATEQRTSDEFDEVDDLLFSPDGSTLAVLINPRSYKPTDTSNAIALLDAMTLKPRCLIRLYENDAKQAVQTGMSWNLAFSPDGKLVAAYGTELRIFEVATRRPVLILSGIGEARGKYAAVVIARDGRVIAVEQDHPQGSKRSIRSLLPWSPQVAIPRGDLWYDAFAFSPDGKMLATATYVKDVLVWDVNRLLGSKPEVVAPLNSSQLNELWSILGGDADSAYAAICKLVQARKGVVTFLKEHLNVVSRRDLLSLIDELDSDAFGVREAASAKLVKFGYQAEPALRAASPSHRSPDFARRLEDLIESLNKGPLPPEVLRSRRSIQVLEYIGTHEARTVLQYLATGDPDAAMTREALNSLQRLKSWEAVDEATAGEDRGE